MVDKTLKPISVNLKNERRLKGYTQTQMAGLLGIKQTTYCRYEQIGTVQGREPDIDTLIKIAKVLGISLDDLCGVDET